MSEFREAFLLFDKDGDGMITGSELETLMRALGQTSSKEDVMELIASVDQEGDGTVTFAEFLSIIGPRMKDEISNQDICDAFEVLDEKGHGEVPAKDIRHMWMTMGEKLTEDEIRETFAKHNVDVDGMVSFQKFTEMMLNSS